MSYAPATTLAARSYLLSRGVPADGLGIVGDTAHGNEGYHCGWDRLSRGYGTGDYSYGESPRDRVKSNAAMALDIGGMSEQWTEDFNVWLVAQCAAGTPDTQDIREVIYRTRDDKVRRWDRLGRRTSGDLSHLWHTHISYFRDSESRDKTALFRRYFEGDTELTPQEHEWLESLILNTGKPFNGVRMTFVDIQTRLDRLAAAVAEVKAAAAKPVSAVPVSVDPAVLSAALRDPGFLAAVAKAVNDDSARRQAS